MFINVRVKDDYFNLKYKEITNVGHLYGLEENKELSKRGGTIVGNTRKAIEEETKRPLTLTVLN